eukprot:scaffold29050_cov112-Isochrysis_galbana.AAC.2
MDSGSRASDLGHANHADLEYEVGTGRDSRRRPPLAIPECPGHRHLAFPTHPEPDDTRVHALDDIARPHLEGESFASLHPLVGACEEELVVDSDRVAQLDWRSIALCNDLDLHQRTSGFDWDSFTTDPELGGRAGAGLQCTRRDAMLDGLAHLCRILVSVLGHRLHDGLR